MYKPILKLHHYWYPCFYVSIADLRDDEASQQVESTQLAAAEIERLVEDKQRLAEHLQQEVSSISLFFLAYFLNFFNFACMYIKLEQCFHIIVYLQYKIHFAVTVNLFRILF